VTTHAETGRPSEQRLAAIRDYYVNSVRDGAGDVEDLFAEIDALSARLAALEAALERIDHRVRTRRIGGPRMDGSQAYAHPLAKEIAEILAVLAGAVDSP